MNDFDKIQENEFYAYAEFGFHDQELERQIKLLTWEKHKDEIASFHDCVFEAIGKSRNEEELKLIFLSLPDSITITALEWGLSDTVFREEVYVYLCQNS